jgi:hypothetical protein
VAMLSGRDVLLSTDAAPTPYQMISGRGNHLCHSCIMDMIAGFVLFGFFLK